MTHVRTDLKVLYFGTPVVLITTRNPDGTANLAPISSAWWINQSCMIGMSNSSQTVANLEREGECVLNLPSSDMAVYVDRLADLTGRKQISDNKIAKGYRFESDKFGASGLTEQPATIVAAPRVAQCPIQLECRIEQKHQFGPPTSAISAYQLMVVRSHVEESLLIPNSSYISPDAWDPLIMKFCEYFGGGDNVLESTLAANWQMPHARSVKRAQPIQKV